MLHIDPSRTDLAREFREAPFGPFSPELQRVLQVLRGGALPGKPIVLAEGGRWAIAAIPSERGRPFVKEPERYDDLGEAMWQLFRRRWQRATGSELDL